MKLGARGARAAAGAVSGAVAGILVMSFWPSASPAKPAKPLRQPRLSLEQNKRPLTKAEVAVLVRWARRYVECANAAGVRLGRPTVGVDEVTISPAASSKISARKLFLRCDTKLGPPPLQTSLVLAREDGRFHVFRPRTCALPPP